MNPIPESKARELQLLRMTNFYRLPSERGLLDKMFAEIKASKPEAEIVQLTRNSFYIGVKSLTALPKQSNPKSMRGRFPTVRAVLGQIGR